MIISHAHKFIFLKTKKTAGTSLELALRTLCGEDDVISPLIEDGELPAGTRTAQNWQTHSKWRSKRPWYRRRWLKTSSHDLGFYNHMPAAEAKALLDDDQIWNSYFKFAFDRNPWDRQVSHFYYRCRSDKPDAGAFRRFMHKDRRARLDNYEIYSLGGEVAVDFVGRYEDLAGDLNKALGEVGLKFEGPLPRAKTTQRIDKRPYAEFYDDETKAMVGDWYAREIGLLGYDFLDGAR